MVAEMEKKLCRNYADTMVIFLLFMAVFVFFSFSFYFLLLFGILISFVCYEEVQENGFYASFIRVLDSCRLNNSNECLWFHAIQRNHQIFGISALKEKNEIRDKSRYIFG